MVVNFFEINYAVNYNELIVDDDQSIRSLLAKILTAEGVNIFEAESGQKSLEMVAAFKFALIFLDVLMPSLDGFEVCKLLKSKPCSHDIPVMFITALDHIDDILKGYDAEGTDYIVKPINTRLTIVRINALLEREKMLNDKLKLVEVNSVFPTKIDSFLKEVSLEQKIIVINKEVTDSICGLFDLLENLKEFAATAAKSFGETVSNDKIALLNKFKEQTAAFLSLLDQAQIQLQFRDRVVQQFNEILKVMQKINSIISQNTAIDQATMQSSTKFVLHNKTSQEEIDDLFAALKSGSS